MLRRNVALFLNASNALSISSRGSAKNITILYAKGVIPEDIEKTIR
jgi:hypothetical protein